MSMIPLTYVLTLSAGIFGIGLYGALARTNAIVILMSIELMLNAVSLNLVAFSRYMDPGSMRGQIFAIFVMTVAAAEAAVGLAIILEVSRKRGIIDLDRINLLKG